MSDVLIKAFGQNCIIQCPFTGQNYNRLCQFPAYSRWQSGTRNRIFKPIASNIRYVQEHWPDAVWEPDVQHHLDRFIRESAEAAQSKVDKTVVLEDDGSYEYKMKPFDHQRQAFLLCRDRPYYALFLEQGCGKSKIAIDKACYLFSQGLIDAVVIIAQNGVHLNWLEEELPKHIPDWCPYKSWGYSSNMTKAREDAFRKTTQADGFLQFYSFNIEGFTSEKAKSKLEELTMTKRLLCIIDESQFIKNSAAKRTKYLIKACDSLPQKMILTGTPVTKGIEDLYAQLRWLHKDVLGFDSFYSFRNHFCTMGGFENKQITGYKNVDELLNLISGYSFRVTKAECLDLPPKLYKRFVVELTPQQRRVYDDLRRNFWAEIKGMGTVTADLAIVRLLRLQQIACGWWPDDEMNPIPGDNPKLEAVRQHCFGTEGSVIVWARFTADINLIYSELRKDHGNDNVAVYSGATPADQRMQIVRDFQAKKIKVLVAHAQAAGRGLTLTACENPIYHSNDFNLELRLQSEDRCHRIGTTGSVTYTDVEAKSTVDRKIITSLRNKKLIADLVTQDPAGFFLEEDNAA